MRCLRLVRELIYLVSEKPVVRNRLWSGRAVGGGLLPSFVPPQTCPLRPLSTTCSGPTRPGQHP